MEEIVKATGRDIRCKPLTTEQLGATQAGHAIPAAHAVPAEYVDGLAGMFIKILDGHNAHVTDGVQRALGRERRDFADYVREAAATGVLAA